MRILVAIDGSPATRGVLAEVNDRPWPAGSEIRVITVVQPPPWMPEPFAVGAELHAEAQRAEERRNREIAEQAATEIRRGHPELVVSATLLLGWPKQELIEEAARWQADLIVLGTQGRGAVGRFLLGSVAHAVALHAPCSVEIVRERPGEAPAT